jgi:soluble lytic murein transglycosylase
VVQKAIEAMPANQRTDNAWTYWLGRARQAQGDFEGSRKLYLQAASPFNFYGKLSLEELGLPVKLPPQAAPLTDAEFQAAAATPGFQRTLVWYQLGQRTEGFKEFNFQLTGLKDRQLIAAAEWARRNELYDRAIAAADRTVNEHDANLRFLTPYKDTMQLQAALAGMDPAWAYGLIRQESRFISVARSGVGASGLMQLMPATAQYMAKKLGMSDYKQEKVTDIAVNLQLGINYLRMMFDQLDNSQVLASAAYNAGPGRPRDWRARLPLGETVEGAIFAEAIPFNETRDYVKKVLSNSTLYAALLEGKPQSLKARLGVISGRGTINISAVDKIE